MAITSTQPAMTPARLGVARLGATRLGFKPRTSNIQIDGAGNALYAWRRSTTAPSPNGPPAGVAAAYTTTRS